MARVLRQVASCSPSRQTGIYIYSITPAHGGGLAAITSADELLILDRQNLTLTPGWSFSDVPVGLTCLKTVDDAGQIVLCTGRDGVAAAFDVRSQTRVAHFRSDRPVTALACKGFDVAIGTELAHQQAIVSVWDRRTNKTCWKNTENNDDITDLQYHPNQPNHLLSGGVDGLVSIFDTNVAEEDDSLLQVVNHGPVHKAGFLSNTAIYALSHDENFSIHPVTSDAESDAEDSPAPVLLGDLRPVLSCEYVIDVVPVGTSFYLAAASHSSKAHISLVPIKNQSELDLDNKLTVLGAHGEEIVRSIFADVQTETIYSAGEDGQIRAFREAAGDSQQIRTPKSPKIRNASEARFRPY